MKRFIQFIVEQTDNNVVSFPSELDRRQSKGLRVLDDNIQKARNAPKPNLLPIGTRVRLHGTPTSGTVHHYPEMRSEKTEGYALHHMTRSRDGVYHVTHLIHTPHIDGTIVGHTVHDEDLGKPRYSYDIHIDPKHHNQPMIPYWTVKPYKRKNGTFAPNANISHGDTPTVSSTFKGQVIAVDAVSPKNRIEIMGPRPVK